MDAANSKPEPVEDGEDDAVFPARYDRFRAMRDDPNREARSAKWQKENARSIEAYNRWFEAEGHKFLRPPLF
jgi:hypothetical protein